MRAIRLCRGGPADGFDGIYRTTMIVGLFLLGRSAACRWAFRFVCCPPVGRSWPALF